MRFKLHCTLLVAVLCAAGAANAQESRNVEIKDGQVWINGSVLPDEAVPQALRAFDGQVNFTFVGDEDPIIGLGDGLYRLEGDRLVEVQGLEGPGLPMSFHFGEGIPFHNLDNLRFNLSPEVFGRVDVRDHVISTIRAESLAVAHAHDMAREHQARLQSLADEMRRSVPPPGGRVRVYRAPSAGDDQLDVRWTDPLENARLRGHLDRERALDQESRRIAQELRQIASEDLRRELERDLRDHLQEVFELRQENRRTEIRELESRLEELHERLERREELRERIVEERMEFLLEEEGLERGR